LPFINQSPAAQSNENEVQTMLETRHLRLIIAITALAILLIISATLIIANSRSKISSKPSKPDSSGLESESQADLKWYIKFSVKNQQATAYVGESYAPLSASGEYCFMGGVAVHPLHPVNYGGSPLQPVIPFGTTLYLEEPVLVQGKEYTSFKVMDTGDVYYGLWPDSPYWLDIYFGTANYYNRLEAKDFGTPRVSYYWFEEWR
jgi:3D (Asp-Asp-Asp) domain-containing protein